MNRPGSSVPPRRPRFGRVDPFCWVAVAAVLGMGVLGFLSQFPQLGIAALLFAALLVAFDSWANRPDLPSGREAVRRPEPPRRR